ncbi:hypothetical protein GALMADRAFT_238928 [Galerina marginata CBS 339.88]|uniref:F-box domain-containing protein n=1 Tax=Galerina marginata (strain CBS 339.88) TaxID=685588 RepID=A0A067TIQ9_GALM3|nr:hypothetical protein GALMADRAFT_238928 [Galerina marginata CBS 339.88]
MDERPYLTKFLQSNDAPSETIFDEVTHLISKPLQELEAKMKEIERIGKSLEDLQTERDDIQKSVDEYNTILSPVRRFSSKILHEIFCYCLPTHRYPIMTITEAPLLLTRICRSWRSVALSSPYIWSKLHIPLLPYSISSYDPWPTWPPLPGQGADTADRQQRQREQEEKYAKTMQARCELAEVWLSRSGSYPLSISLKFFEGFGPVSRGDLDDGNPLSEIFNMVLSYSTRMEVLELSMPFEIYQMFQNMVSLEMVPNLQSFRANFFQGVAPHLDATVDPVMFLQAPNLRSLSLFTGIPGVPVFDSMNIPSTWKNLSKLFFHSPITSAETVQVLRWCQNLDQCKLSISDGVDIYIAPEDVLSLPCLRSLCIQISGLDTMTVMYRRIEAPRLNSFEYSQGQNQYSPGVVHNSSHSSPTLSMLEKSKNIRKLAFDPPLFTAQDVLFAFRFASNLTHLILGPHSHKNRIHPHSPGYRTISRSFDLNLLVVGEPPNAVLPASAPRREVLLPKLEVFEAYTEMANVTDETLLQFILGRLGDPEGKGVSSLKTVKIAFERTKQSDVSDEVHQRAKEVGVEILLDLTYYDQHPPNTSKYADILSPWYGLSDPAYGAADGDRSWNYPDDEMEEY